jgi:hypothetical protein
LDYLSPESLAGQRGDARADIYALGMTLYFALAGRLPARPSPHLPPPASPNGYRPSEWRSDVPAWLDDVIACATTALPADRYSSAALFAEALSREQTAERRLPHASHHLTFCLLCGADEPLGLGLCAGCAGSTPSARQGRLILERPLTAHEREHSRQRLRALTGPRASGQAIDSAARGERVLARVPVAGTERVLERLSAEGVTARVVRGPWVPLPRAIYGVGAAMAGMGWLAGSLAQPDLIWMSPLLAALVLLEAQRRVRKPVLAAPAAAGVLTGPARDRLAATVARLPAGTALSLLADLARNAQSVLGRVQEPVADGLRAEVEDLVARACEAATDLADLEDCLDRLERQRDRPRQPPVGWNAAVARAERLRDALVQRLLDAITALGEARVRVVEASSLDGDRLVALSGELRREVSAYAEARREVEALLS